MITEPDHESYARDLPDWLPWAFCAAAMLVAVLFLDMCASLNGTLPH